MFILPETFMNKSGNAVSPLITSIKKAKNLIVIHDDLDLPIGRVKMSFNRGSGGHKGVESIIKKIKTEAFTRIRVGISPKTPSGKTKKPIGGEAVQKHILGKFKETETKELKKIGKISAQVLEIFANDGLESAIAEMNKN